MSFSRNFTNKVHPSKFGCLFIRILACTGKCMSLLRKRMPVCASTNDMNKYVYKWIQMVVTKV